MCTQHLFDEESEFIITGSYSEERGLAKTPGATVVEKCRGGNGSPFNAITTFLAKGEIFFVEVSLFLATLTGGLYIDYSTVDRQLHRVNFFARLYSS